MLKKITVDILIDEDIPTEFVLDSIQEGLKNRKYTNMNDVLFSFKEMNSVYYPKDDKFVCPITLTMEMISHEDQKQDTQRIGTCSGSTQETKS